MESDILYQLSFAGKFDLFLLKGKMCIILFM